MIMNKERRNKIQKYVGLITEIKDGIEEIKEDEEMAFDNLPENLQGSFRGEEMEEAIDHLEEAIDNIDNAIMELEEI